MIEGHGSTGGGQPAIVDAHRGLYMILYPPYVKMGAAIRLAAAPNTYTYLRQQSTITCIFALAHCS